MMMQTQQQFNDKLQLIWISSMVDYHNLLMEEDMEVVGLDIIKQRTRNIN